MVAEEETLQVTLCLNQRLREMGELKACVFAFDPFSRNCDDLLNTGATAWTPAGMQVIINHEAAMVAM